jgi:hypothetical protein
VACVRRLEGRGEGEPSDTRRVPNFAFADDSRPYEDGAPIPLLLVPLGPRRPLMTGETHFALPVRVV